MELYETYKRNVYHLEKINRDPLVKTSFHCADSGQKHLIIVRTTVYTVIFIFQCYQGDQGEPGNKGDDGTRGEPGLPGEPGRDGLMGFKGEKVRSS